MTRLFVFAALLASLLAAPARADTEYCNDYWFVRNQIMNRAGYCFSSPLGQALFNNADCTTTTPALSPRDGALVAEIRAIEGRLGCAVNTNATSLPIPLLPMRLALEDIVARDENSGFGCFGWSGPAITLHTGHRAQAPVLYTIQPGDDLIMLYNTMGAPAGWDFIEAKRNGQPVAIGWGQWRFDPAWCAQVAG